MLTGRVNAPDLTTAHGWLNTDKAWSIKELKGKIVLLRKGHGFIRFDSSQMAQIGFVADQHDNNVGFCMVAKLLQPTLDVLKSSMLRDVINKQRTNCSSVRE